MAGEATAYVEMLWKFCGQKRARQRNNREPVSRRGRENHSGIMKEGLEELRASATRNKRT
jgi:hypothetical protein